MSSNRSRPLVNIGTIGHTGHGKSTLTSAILVTLGKMYGRTAPVDGQKDNKKYGQPVVHYETETRRYAHFDCGGDMLQMIPAAIHMDAAILVVAATNGPEQQTREAIKLARGLGVPYIVVFLSKCDLKSDDEELELLGLEVRDLLSQYDYSGNITPIVNGSGLKGLEGDAQWDVRIVELAEHLDSYVPDPEHPSGTSSQDSFDAEVSMLGGGDQTRDTQAVEFSFHYEDSPVAGSLQLVMVGKDKNSDVRHGVKVKLNKKIMLREGLHFYWEVGSEVKGYRRVSKIKS
jgi:translation elongation factor TU